MHATDIILHVLPSLGVPCSRYVRGTTYVHPYVVLRTYLDQGTILEMKMGDS